MRLDRAVVLSRETYRVKGILEPKIHHQIRISLGNTSQGGAIEDKAADDILMVDQGERGKEYGF